MNPLTKFLDWLLGKQKPPISNTHTDIDRDVYLPKPKPEPLSPEREAHFPDPRLLPVSTFFDLQTAPDYARVGIGQSTGSGGGNAQNTLREFIRTITSAPAPAVTPTPALPSIPSQPSYSGGYRTSLPTEVAYYGPPPISSGGGASPATIGDNNFPQYSGDGLVQHYDPANYGGSNY